ncbi:phosphotransferase [archaeon]|jgi:homoserine kinase type II|nr:phosphotransferase [archaeon]MBT3577372.1 phosphotransferase [archaeon]MBT6820385.1 phosphotransferase [archaeon]MBT7025199.1 phosphotransferase [archaeon]MBT7238794.1 phosphotransferase [archaeon]
MKITKQEVERATKLYDLGKVKKISSIGGGLVNYNFNVKTDGGDYVFRFLGRKLDDYKKRKLKLEFRVLNYLKKKKFPYRIPDPIKNKKGQVLTTVKGRNLWIYERIKGKKVSKINGAQLKSLVKALAVYHKYVSSMNARRLKEDYIWLMKKYSVMEKVKPKNKVDRIMLENIDLFKDCLKDVSINLETGLLANHTDFHQGNLLFDGNEVVGILDFESVIVSPRVRDIAYAVKQYCFNKSKLSKSKMKNLLREYQKINPLSKKEIAMILPFIIRDSCVVFWWFYSELKKSKHKQYLYLKSSSERVKGLLREIK